MDFLLELPVWIGLLVVIIAIIFSGLIVVTQLKKIIYHKLTKEHEKVGRILFRVTAGLIALLISLSYANERMNQSKIIDSMETEAALIINMAMHLNLYNSKESKLIVNKLSEYVDFTITDDWKNIGNNPFFSQATNSLVALNKLIYKLPVTGKNQELLKNKLIDEVIQVNKLMQVRIFSQHGHIPYLIYILGVGLMFIWVFFTVYNLDLISLSFFSLYNFFIAVLIYFVFMLSNPLVGPLKIEAHSFIIIKSKGFDILQSE